MNLFTNRHVKTRCKECGDVTHITRQPVYVIPTYILVIGFSTILIVLAGLVRLICK